MLIYSRADCVTVTACGKIIAEEPNLQSQQPIFPALTSQGSITDPHCQCESDQPACVLETERDFVFYTGLGGQFNNFYSFFFFSLSLCTFFLSLSPSASPSGLHLEVSPQSFILHQHLQTLHT